MNQDAEHLKLLSIFHYIVGGITALFSCMFLFHIAMGIAVLSGACDGKEPPPHFIGWLFILIPGLFMICGWALSACIIIAGQRLAQHRSRLYCLVVAAFECMMMPFGTVLGVFTIILLMKESVKEIFSQPPPSPYAKPEAAG